MYQFLISLVKFIPKQFIIFDVTVNDIASLNAFLNSFFLVYRNATGLCMLILYSATSMNSLISSNSFGGDVGGVFRVFYKEDHVICKQRKIFTGSVPIWIPFCSIQLLWLGLPVLCWIKVARVGVLARFRILKEKSSVFHHRVWC